MTISFLKAENVLIFKKNLSSTMPELLNVLNLSLWQHCRY